MALFSNSGNKSILLRLLIVAFVVYMLFSLGSLVGELAESKARLAAVQTEIKETADRIEERKNLLENSTKEELIERFARERLGYCFPNEVVFVDISGS
jgi:cell division protein FtsB